MADSIDLQSIDPRVFFEGSTAPENRFILENVGSLNGKRVLELGCGVGEGSVYLATRGAECVATDASPRMVEIAGRVAERDHVRIRTRVMDAQRIDFPDASFDIVYAANVLHHVDVPTALAEMCRVTRPGGKVCFWDPLRHNPIINVYRRIAVQVRSPEEKPLDMSILRLVREKFSSVVYDTFWLSTLWIFVRFYFLDRLDPNQVRYWKRILEDEERLRETYTRLERVDNVMKKVPFIKRYAWNIAVVATK